MVDFKLLLSLLLWKLSSLERVELIFRVNQIKIGAHSSAEMKNKNMILWKKLKYLQEVKIWPSKKLNTLHKCWDPTLPNISGDFSVKNFRNLIINT